MLGMKRACRAVTCQIKMVEAVGVPIVTQVLPLVEDIIIEKMSHT